MRISHNIDRPLILMTGFTSHQLCFLKSLFHLTTQGPRITMLELMPLVMVCLYNMQNDVGPLSKSIGADSMMIDSSKRFTRIDPSLKNHGKRADFSVVSSKSDHVLLSLEAKSSKTKHIHEIVKLCRELKDSMKEICNAGYSGVIVSGILLKGNCCHIYSMDHVYDGLYRVVLLKVVNFPSDCYQMYQLLPIFHLFEKLQTIVQSSALKLRNRPAPATRPLDSIVFIHSPMIIGINKRKLDRNDPAVKHGRRRLFPPKKK